MRYLIFGGTGSLGRKLIERYLSLESSSVNVYSRDESKHWTLRNEFTNHSRAKSLKFFVGDIRDKDRVRNVIDIVEPHVIIIASALKQIDTCERSPNESVMTNLIGTQNVINAVNEYGMMYNKVKKVLFVSTDKSCSSVSVYGMCKAISERLVTSNCLNDSGGHASIDYLCTRYGNVLESRGSILPLFKYQAQNSSHITVTDPEMTRFLMTLDDSVDLINHALTHGKSGETWVPKIPSMMIGDLAEIFSESYDKPIKIVGLRPGEKKHEDLINETESIRTDELENHYVINSVFSGKTGRRFTYSSNDNVFTKNELKNHLEKLGVLDRKMEDFPGIKIEEIMTNGG